jgi:hypothetical protein
MMMLLHHYGLRAIVLGATERPQSACKTMQTPRLCACGAAARGQLAGDVHQHQILRGISAVEGDGENAGCAGSDGSSGTLAEQ